MLHSYSSEEDSEDFGLPQRWNPNSFIDAMKSASNQEEKLKLKKELIDKFLESTRPLLTPKMTDFLIEPGVTETLIRFVTRVDESNKNNNNKQQRPLNPTNDEVAVRKSYNVVDLFQNPKNDMSKLLSEKLETILTELFTIFRPDSIGNFHHFSKILEQIILRAPLETTRTLMVEKLLWKMVDFLHEAPIADSFINILTTRFSRQSENIQFFKSLLDAKIFDIFGERLFGTDTSAAVHVSEFFIRMIERLVIEEMAGILFIGLGTNLHFFDNLFRVIENKDNRYSAEQQRAIAELVREIVLKSAEKMVDMADPTKHLPNVLSLVHDKIHAHAARNIKILVNRLIQMNDDDKRPVVQFSAFTVKKSFGIYRYYLVSILADLISINPTYNLPNIPIALWKIMGEWFLEYKHNNLYQNEFFKLYRVIVRLNYIEVLKPLFQEGKFLTRLCEQLASTELSSAKGFIIQMLNMLRFQGQLVPLPPDPRSWLRQYLVSHDQWKAAQVKLKQETTTQLLKYSDLDTDEDEDPAAMTELGSYYALGLGFEETEGIQAPAESSPSKKKKKKKNKKKGKVAPNGDVVPINTANPGKAEDEPEAPSPNAPKEKNAEPKAAPNWWTDIVSELKEEEKSKGMEAPKELPSNWWSDLQKELEAAEKSPDNQK